MDVHIRQYHPEDADALFDAVRESVAEIGRWLPWCHEGYTRGDAQQYVGTRHQLFEEGTEYSFAVVDGSDRLLGGCGINQINRVHRMANLGYWVRTSATGRGVAVAAVRHVADFAYRQTDLRRLEIICDVDNHASQRTAARTGAVQEGVLHDRLFVHDRPHDAVMFAITRRMWGAWNA